MSPSELASNAARADELPLTERISAAMVELYAAFYAHDRTTAVTNINNEGVPLAAGARGQVTDGRVALQTETEGESTAATERPTRRRVVAFGSATSPPPVSHELFFLDAAPLTPEIGNGSR